MNGLIGRTISRYRILEQIGQGGMSSVFRAHDLRDNRPVAVKILSPYLAHDPAFHARFEREVRLLSQLRHPNIVPILDCGEADGVAFIVMPLLATGTLHERLRSGPLDPVEGGRIVAQIASALQLAHDHGVVHRDVKPSNVLIDDQGNALLSDFSFARTRDASQNLTGSALVGTPAYMSPEQCLGHPIDARSDQYSMAVMLYQISTGQMPFDGDTPMAIAMKHVNTPLPRPRLVNPNLPEGVELVLIRALAKDPALRYASVRALNAAFQAALASALDPHQRAAAARTQSLSRTTPAYQKYQNVRPPVRRVRFDRAAILAALLLALVCVVSAGATAIFAPAVFAPAAAPAAGPVDVHATVDAVLTAEAPQAGTGAPSELVRTEVFLSVLQTLEAAGLVTLAPTETRVPTDSSGTATPRGIAPAATHTIPATSTRTVTPSRTSTRSSTATIGASPTGPAATATSTAEPSATSTPSATAPPPTATESAPTDTAPPPSSTAPAPTSTSPAPSCAWNAGNPHTSGDTVSVRVNNTGGLPVIVRRVTITWTGDDHLRHMRWRFEGSFWSGNDPGPTVSSGTSKAVPLATYRTVEFEFWGFVFSGDASVEIDADC